jgi:hypothetical protein
MVCSPLDVSSNTSGKNNPLWFCSPLDLQEQSSANRRLEEATQTVAQLKTQEATATAENKIAQDTLRTAQKEDRNFRTRRVFMGAFCLRVSSS